MAFEDTAGVPSRVSAGSAPDRHLREQGQQDAAEDQQDDRDAGAAAAETVDTELLVALPQEGGGAEAPEGEDDEGEGHAVLLRSVVALVRVVQVLRRIGGVALLPTVHAPVLG